MEKELKQEFEKIHNKFDSKFQELDSKIEEVGDQIQALANHVDRRFEEINTRIARIEAVMVTKEYLDAKLASFARVNNLKLRDEGDEQYI